MTRKWLGFAFVAIATVLHSHGAPAQTVNSVVVSTCGTPPHTYPAGRIEPNTQDTTGAGCINGTISATNPSVGTNNTTAPTSSTQIGTVDGTGKLQPASAANPVPITGSITATNPSVSTTGAAVPGSATYSGMNVGGNLTGFTGTANGLKTDGSAVTQPVSAATLPLPSGAATSANQASVQGTVGAGTAPANMNVTGGVFNTSSPTLTNGQSAAFQLDGTGDLIVDVVGPVITSAASVTTTQSGSVTTLLDSGGTNITDATNHVLNVNVKNNGVAAGTSSAGATYAPTALLSQTACNAASNTNNQLNPQNADLKGNGCTKDASTSATGAAVPANAAYVGMNVSGNLTGLTGTANGLKVDASGTTQPISGTITANQGTAAASTAGWPITAGTVAEATAAWTSATAGNTALTQTITGYNSVLVTLNQGSTITGGVVTFEGSDTTAFTNAYAAQCVDTDDNLASTTFTLVASDNESFICPMNGFAAFRVRLSTVISGTATVNVGVQSTSVPASVYSNVTGSTVTANAGTGTFSTNTAQVNGATTSTGSGAVGTGSQRIAVGQDTATIAGSAPGTAGTASANVLSIQGIASMTPLNINPTAFSTTTNNGTVTTGGTFQQISAANTSRHALNFQNRSGNGDACYLFFGATGSATLAKSIKIADQQGWNQSTVPPSDAIQVTCATSADAYWETEQ